MLSAQHLMQKFNIIHHSLFAIQNQIKLPYKIKWKPHISYVWAAVDWSPELRSGKFNTDIINYEQLKMKSKW